MARHVHVHVEHTVMGAGVIASMKYARSWAGKARLKRQ
jgi:hypothetical protein